MLGTALQAAQLQCCSWCSAFSVDVFHFPLQQPALHTLQSFTHQPISIQSKAMQWEKKGAKQMHLCSSGGQSKQLKAESMISFDTK